MRPWTKFVAVALFLWLHGCGGNQSNMNGNAGNFFFNPGEEFGPSPCQPPVGYFAIATAEDLNNIRHDLTANYFLCNDIELTEPFVPIAGADGSFFRGSLDGNNKIIRNLEIDSSGKMYVGLFERLLSPHSRIHHLHFESPKIQGGVVVGTLAGESYAAIESCTVFASPENPGFLRTDRADRNGFSAVGGLVGLNRGPVRFSQVGDRFDIFGLEYTGGLLGINDSQTVEDSGSSATVFSVAGVAGGLVGEHHGGLILRSYARGDVIAPEGWHVGGLVGLSSGGNITQSFAHGRVSGRVVVGGLVGSHNYSHQSYELGQIVDCYAQGNVSGYDTIGGLAGVNRGFIQRVYSTGRVIHSAFDPEHAANAGGIGLFIVQDKEGSQIRDSIFNQTENPEFPSDERGVGKTTLEMKSLNTYLPSWDISYTDDSFNSVWKIQPPDGSRYPQLFWELP